MRKVCLSAPHMPVPRGLLGLLKGVEFALGQGCRRVTLAGPCGCMCPPPPPSSYEAFKAHYPNCEVIEPTPPGMGCTPEVGPHLPFLLNIMDKLPEDPRSEPAFQVGLVYMT